MKVSISGGKVLVLGLALLAGGAGHAHGYEKTFYYHNDHLATPQMMTDDVGTAVWEAEYRPFGEATVNEDPDGDGILTRSNVRFPGQYFDGETGLHYNWHRFYEAGTGRYLQADPIGIERGRNHLYVYVSNNPITAFDFYGLWEAKGFPAGLQGQITAAVEEALKKLKSESECDGGCLGSKDKARRLADLLDKSTIVYKPELRYCGYTPFKSLIYSNEIQLGPLAFDFMACCKLSSTIVHEVVHLNRGTEGSAAAVEKSCFGCGK